MRGSCLFCLGGCAWLAQYLNETQPLTMPIGDATLLVLPRSVQDKYESQFRDILGDRFDDFFASK